MTLWEINEKLNNYQMEIDPETGEWLNESELDELKMSREEKIESMSLVVKNKQALRSALAEENKNFTQRMKALDNEIDRLKNKIGFELEYKPFETSKVKLSFRRSESVEIKDDAKIPDEYLNIEVKRAPRKDAIKKYLKGIEGSDETCEWAELVRKQNLQIK